MFSIHKVVDNMFSDLYRDTEFQIYLHIFSICPAILNTYCPKHIENFLKGMSHRNFSSVDRMIEEMHFWNVSYHKKFIILITDPYHYIKGIETDLPAVGIDC